MTTTPFEPVELPSRYAKAIVATLIAVVTALSTALTDSVVSSLELAGIGIALLTAVAVYWVPNAPEGWRHYAKALVAVLGTALQALVPFLVEGHVTPAQWLLVLLAGIGALAVGVVPNAASVLPARLAKGEDALTWADVKAAYPTLGDIKATGLTLGEFARGSAVDSHDDATVRRDE